MKNLSVEISLDNPCSEDWSQMDPVEHGRFCASCRKTVVDMTSWTASDLVSYFNANPTGTCGRFNQHQLNRRFNDEPLRRKSSPGYRKAVALVLSFFALQSAMAQQRRETSTEQATPANLQPEDVRISGTVTDGDSVPLPDVLIEFNGKSLRSNSAGDFEILVAAAELRAGIIVFSYDGLPNEVRNYNPAMRSTRYDVQLRKPSGNWGYSGAPVVTFFLADDGKSNFVTVNADVLDAETRAMLGNVAAMMAASPHSRVALQANSGKNPRPGIRRALMIRNYISEVMNIDAGRFLIPKPKRTTSQAERNRVYFRSWDNEMQ